MEDNKNEERYLNTGRAQPQNIEIEQAVLGILLLESKSIPTVMHILDSHLFYLEKHKLIFQGIQEMYQNGDPIDILTITHHLKKSKKLVAAGGPAYITGLIDRPNSAANLEAHCRIIQESSIKRSIIQAASSLQIQAFDDQVDALDLLGQFADVANDMHKYLKTGVKRRTSEAYIQFLKNVESAKAKPDKITGIPSALKRINDLTGGWQDSELIVKAGRPGMGKTADMITEIKHIVFELNIPTLVFSLEMSSIQLIGRLVSQMSATNGQLLTTGRINDKQFEDIQARSQKLYTNQADENLHIIDDPGLSLNEMVALAKMYAQKYGIRKIFIDYLQLISVTDRKVNSREQEIATIARGLKNLAKALEVPVTAYAQLSRKVEERADKRPRLSDLRESGEIENAADMVFMYYRWEYYGFTQDDDHQDSKGKALILVEKYRGGAQKDIKVGYIAEFTQFVNMNELKDYLAVADKSRPDYDGQADMFEEKELPEPPEFKDNPDEEDPF